MEIYRLESWRDRALAGLELGLKDRHGEPLAAALEVAKRHIGELSMENELLRERARTAEQRLPLPIERTATLEADVGLSWAGPRGERVLPVHVDHRRQPSSVQSRRAGD